MSKIAPHQDTHASAHKPAHTVSIDPAALYSLALAIGGSTDVQVMLSTAIDAFLRTLDCSSASIFGSPVAGAPATPILALPRELPRNQATQCAAALLSASTERGEWEHFCRSLPDYATIDGGGHLLLLPVGVLGVLALVHHGAPFAPTSLHELALLTGRLGAAWEICLRHEALAATHRSTLLERNMLRALIAGTPTIVFALDTEGRFVVSEGRGLQSLGRLPGQVVGESIFDVYADVPLIVENVRAALGGQHRNVTVQIQNRSYDAMYTPVVDEDGTVTGVVGVAHDVTDRKAAVDTLGAVLNTVGESILTLDAHGKITMVNQELERVFGYRQAELLTRPLSHLIPDIGRLVPHGDQSNIFAHHAHAIMGRRVQMEGKDKNGHAIPVEVCFNAMSIGDEQYYTGSIRDISDQLEYDRLRDEFVATVSHELRTPLASIMGWTETLLTGHPGPLNDQQKRFLEIVLGSSQRLDRLIEEVLTVSRIQRGTLRLSRDPVYPVQLFATLRDTTVKMAERQGITVAIDDMWPPERLVIGDANLLSQVLANLLANAIKFSSTGSMVTVRSSEVHGAWRVEIIDHGMGIPEADLPRLFQRFTRGSNARAAHIQGTGLGLYVSKAVIEGHRGEINLTSREGVGTTVWFEIPGE